MDIGAYLQIDTLQEVMKVNNIEVPRLRGLRIMKDENPYSKDEVEKLAYNLGVSSCEGICRSRFGALGWCVNEYSMQTDQIVKKYMTIDKDSISTGVRWSSVHGKKRRMFKYAMKQAKRIALDHCLTFNQFCGRDDVLFIHARVGGDNWTFYKCDKTVATQDWFICKVDDPWDSTYCDIYANIKRI